MSKNHNRQELRFLILCIAFFGMGFWFLPSSDHTLSEEECQRLLVLGEEKYRIDFAFDNSWNFVKPECNSPETAILNALYFIDNSVIFLPSSEQEFDFYEWAKNIKPILQRQDILAFSAKASFAERRIDISNLELEKGNPVSISNILVHELRHLEEGKNTHVPCLRQRNATCDARLEENLFEGGAYNYNVAYLHRLIEYSTISRSQKHSASELLSNTLETRINAISDEARAKY
jgi:hypothetical protein